MSETIISLSTSFGEIKFKLYNETPQHRDNFIKLVEKGFYNDLLFHRVIQDFMIQGGDPDSKNAPAGKNLGAGDVGYTIPAEFVYPQYFHKKGALSAARQGDQMNPKKASSGCQFYLVQGKVHSDAELDKMEKAALNGAKQKRFEELVSEKAAEVKAFRMARDQAGLDALRDEMVAVLEAEFAGKKGVPFTAEQREAYTTVGGTPFLDNEYTVFGEVIEGLDIIDKIAAVETTQNDRPKADVKMTMKIA
ncbi:MAG: peptidylprolyl isomerase [Paludibacteraceae bacterium]|nr:peptidylprolyl isomerase [Paludibacteraceae bacterium]